MTVTLILQNVPTQLIEQMTAAANKTAADFGVSMDANNDMEIDYSLLEEEMQCELITTILSAKFNHAAYTNFLNKFK